MRKLIIMSALLFSTVFAKNNYELKLYEKVLPSIFTTSPIKIYTDKNSHEVLKNSSKFQILNKCNKEVIFLIGKNFNEIPAICEKKPVFSTSYRSFKENQNSFGAFYWSKGRPQIRFKSDAIEKYGLKLPQYLKKYIK